MPMRKICAATFVTSKYIDPLITYAALTEKLNNRLNYSFDPRYIAKLARKVDPLHSWSRSTVLQIEQWLIGIREHFRAACEEAKPKEFGTRQLSGPVLGRSNDAAISPCRRLYHGRAVIHRWRLA